MALFRNILLLALGTLLGALQVQAQTDRFKEEDKLPDIIMLVSYKVLDTVKGEISFQDVKVRVYSEPSPHYRLERKDSETKKLLSTEVSAEWGTVMFSEDDKYYADQVLTQNVGGDENLFYGRIEIKSFEDHHIAFAWPVIGKITYNMYTHIKSMTAYMSKGKKLIITEVFENNNKTLPLVRKQQIVDKNKNVISEVYYTRM